MVAKQRSKHAQGFLPTAVIIDKLSVWMESVKRDCHGRSQREKDLDSEFRKDKVWIRKPAWKWCLFSSIDSTSYSWFLILEIRSLNIVCVRIGHSKAQLYMGEGQSFSRKFSTCLLAVNKYVWKPCHFLCVRFIYWMSQVAVSSLL